MLRRILFFLLVMILPLQAIAAVQMGLSSCHAKDLSHLQVTLTQDHPTIAQGHTHAHTHHHADSAAGSGDDACSNCTDCDLCTPPLAFTLVLNLSKSRDAAMVGPIPSSNGVLPRSFDRPPRSALLA